MRNLSFLFVAILAFGCKKGGGDCAKAIDHGMELSKAIMAKEHGADDKSLAKMRDVGIQHCKDDKWSDEAIKCMIDAKEIGEAQACYGKLSPEQQQKMNQAAKEMAPATPPPPPGGAGSAPAGSDTAGSASGSAH